MEHLVSQLEVDKGTLTAVASPLLEQSALCTVKNELTLLRRRAHARNVSFSKLATVVNFTQESLVPRSPTATQKQK